MDRWLRFPYVSVRCIFGSDHELAQRLEDAALEADADQLIARIVQARQGLREL
jgi:hypothetical protein|eukprot:COSAG01_NODE_9334_length_2481_cov_1.465995_4_plen_53_part_00